MAIVRYSPAETRLFARRFRAWAWGVGALWLAALSFLNEWAPNRPVQYADDLDHFYYGSIGSDLSGGLPVKVLTLLPALFPEHLPPGAPRDLTAFGFLQEEGRPLPIGFSVRRQFIDRTQINCAACHTGILRSAAGEAPIIVPAMPANTVDLLAFFRFLFDVAADERFNARTILDGLEARGDRELFDGPVYRIGIPIMRDALLARRERNAMFFEPGYTAFLPGRVNTFDTFKVDQFADFYAREGVVPTADEMFGIVDFPSVWNQAPRDGLWLHWDGNQSSVRERNFSAAIGAGTLPHEMDIDSLFRVEAWLNDLPAPAYPFAVDGPLAAQGAAIYQSHCSSCHDFGQPGVGRVFELAEIGTDPHRARSYTDVLRRAQMDYTRGHFWSFRNFRDTDGYAAPPLDGIWARAPYLHNGSVPSMWDLLAPAPDRPVAFEVGVDVYDAARMGFSSARLVPADHGYDTLDGAPYGGRRAVLDTRQKGNAATGHTGPAYGTDLPDADKRALIEYLKTK